MDLLSDARTAKGYSAGVFQAEQTIFIVVLTIDTMDKPLCLV